MAAPPTTTVRIPVPTHQYIAELAEALAQPHGAVVAQAIEMLRRRVFAQRVAAEFTALRRDDAAWKAYLADEPAPG
jgi:hypothetical protein